MRPFKNNLIATCGFLLLKFFNRFKNIGEKVEIESDFKIVDISVFDITINTFWENIRNNFNFIIEKNWKYLNWRYCDYRSSNKGRYFVKLAEHGEEILGFIVYEIRENEQYSEGYILDLLVLPGRKDVARKLLEDANKFFKELDINAVHYRVVKNHTHQTLFSEQGFIEVPSKLLVTIKTFYKKEKMQVIKDSNPNQVNFNYGDYY
jgi:hypothetical protein